MTNRGVDIVPEAGINIGRGRGEDHFRRDMFSNRCSSARCLKYSGIETVLHHFYAGCIICLLLFLTDDVSKVVQHEILSRGKMKKKQSQKSYLLM